MISADDVFTEITDGFWDEEWYIEEGIKCDSNNVYCKELVDEKFALKTDIPEPVDLTNYALKSDIPEQVDLNGYRQKNDLSHSYFVDLEFKNEILPDGSDITYLYPIDRNNFTNKCPEKIYLKGSFNNANEETVEFDLEFKNDNHYITDEQWSCKINEKYSLLWCYNSSWTFAMEVWDIETEDVYNKITFESAKILISDEFALKSEIEKLKAENAELKLQIEMLTPKYKWQEFYHDFNERVEFMDYSHINRLIYYTFDNSSKSVTIRMNIDKIDKPRQYLLILNDDNFNSLYIRINFSSNIAYVNEIANQTITSNIKATFSFTITGLVYNDLDSGSIHYFSYVFAKSVE